MGNKKANALMRLAAKGYGWYLALKIGKAALAVPCFLLWLPLWTLLTVVVCAWEMLKIPATLAKEWIESVLEFWSKPWFRGFTRSYYKSLTHYAKLVPRPSEDITK
jgi:hypothetical protein